MPLRPLAPWQRPIAWQPDPLGTPAQRRHRIVIGAGDDEYGSVPVTRERADEKLEPDRERERLVSLFAAERDDVLRRRPAGEHVAVRRPGHRHVGDKRRPVGAGDPDREGIRPRQRRATVGVRESRGRGRCERGHEAPVRQPPHPVPEHARGEAVARDDHPRRPGRLG